MGKCIYRELAKAESYPNNIRQCMSYKIQANYEGGDGNDLTLTVVQ